MRKGMKKCAVLLLAAAMVFETLPMTANAAEASVNAAEVATMAEREVRNEREKSVKTVTEDALAVTVTEAPAPTTETEPGIEVPDVVMGGIITGTTGPNSGISYSYNSATKTLTISGADTGFRGGYIGDAEEPVSAFDNIATDIETVVVQNCTLNGDIYYMFANQKNLKSVAFSNVNTANATDMAGMFYGCESLVSLDLTGLNTANVQYMELMFFGCTALTNLNVSNFNTANVIDMYSMFEGCQNIDNLNLTSFNTANVGDFMFMFNGCKSLRSLNLRNFRTANVLYFGFMFNECSSLQSLDISNFNTSKGEFFTYMFAGCESLKSLDLSHFNTANASYLSGMFSGCTALESLNVSSFNTKLVSDMSYMFYNCVKLTSLNVSNFNTSNVTDIDAMFADCIRLETIDVRNFNTSKVTCLDNMFSNCDSLERLDLSNFNLSSLESAYGVFDSCDNLNVIYTPKAIATGMSISLPALFNVENGGAISEVTKDYCNKVLIRNVPATRAITLSVPKAATKLTINNNMQFTVTVAGEALPVATYREFNWTVSDPNVLSVSDKGVVTGVGMGTATVTCTSKFNAAETASYQFTIEMPFTDIKATDWQYPYVLYAYQNDLMGGKGEGKFDMNGNITRGEFVTVLYSNANKPAVTYEDCFTDVPEGKWFADAVIWAKQNSVTAGNPDGSFGVFTNITREQLVVMLYQYAKSNGINTDSVTEDLSSFADAPKVSSWAAEAMKWGVQNSIIGGKNKADGTYLEPQGKTARGECATMMMRYVELANQ